MNIWRIRINFTIAVVAGVFLLLSLPALSDHEGLWVGTIRHVSNSEIHVYSSEHRRNLIFDVAPPHVPVVSPDGKKEFEFSDLKLGEMVRVHFTTPFASDYYGTVAGASQVRRIDLMSGAGFHASIHQALKATIPSPKPSRTATVQKQAPIIFVSPSP